MLNQKLLFLFFTFSLVFFQNCGQYQSSPNELEINNLSSTNVFLKASDFVDTGANYSLIPDNSLFDFDISTGVMMVSTNSTLDNIHSHYADGGTFANYVYSGSMMTSDVASGVGVTFLSDYPNSDDYYRLSKDSNTQSFHLSARNSTACQGVDSGVVAQAGEWYSFKIMVETDATKTTILAKVWPSFAREPFDAQMSCVDTSSSRLTKGTVGLWSSGNGAKSWGDLFIGFDPYTPSPPQPTPVPQSCGTLAHGQSESITRYQTQTVPFGSTCQSEVQTRTCNDGQLSAYTPSNYQFGSCTVDPAPTPAPLDSDGDGMPDSTDPCPNDPTNACQSGNSIANAAALNTALANAKGGEVFLLASGNYGSFRIDGRQYSSRVTIKSANKSAPAIFNQLTVKNSSNITFDGLTFDYKFNTNDYQFSAYFFLDSVSKMTFINCLFDGDVARTGGAIDGFGYTMGLKGQYVTDLNVINNTFHTWHRGLYFLFGSNIRISGNDIHTIRSDGMNFGEITGLTIEKNYMHDFKSPTGVGDHRDMIQILRSTGKGSSDIVIRNNIFDQAAGDYSQTIWAGGDGSNDTHKRVLIENNIVYGGHINGVIFHISDNVIFRKNTVLVVSSNNHSVPSLGAPWSSNVTVDRNIVQQIAGNSDSSTGNAFLKPTDYSANFVIHATSQANGYNEFSLKPGSTAANLGAGSDLMKLYPIGKASTVNKLRSLP